MRTPFLLGGLGLGILIVMGLSYGPAWWEAWRGEEVTEPAAAALVQTPSAVESAATASAPDPTDAGDLTEIASELDEPELPELAQSDAFVKTALSAWSLPAVILQREDLVARFAVVIQNAADGRLPRRQLGFLLPDSGFITAQVGERIYVDPASYQRYDRYLDVLERIPAQRAADFLELVTPLVGDALAELGERRGLDELMTGLFSRIENAPVLAERVELIRPNVMYAYADEDLEARAEFDKQLLRLGPDNLRRLQAYVQAFKSVYQSE